MCHSTTQPELMQILRNLTYGDIYAIGNLDDKTRELVTLVVLTTNQNLPQIKAHTDAALNVGVSPIRDTRGAVSGCRVRWFSEGDQCTGSGR